MSAGLQPVGLGQHQLVGHRGAVEVLHRLAVALLHAVARIDQDADPLQGRPAAQVGRRQILPGRLGRARDLGEAVARQVDETERIGEVEEVDLPGAAGRGRDPRQRSPAGERVDQARLADIGAAGEGDLRQRDRRQRLERGRARDEVAGTGEQLARRLELGRPRSSGGLIRPSWPTPCRPSCCRRRCRRLAGAGAGAAATGTAALAGVLAAADRRRRGGA